jgi:hypothetical protein
MFGLPDGVTACPFDMDGVVIEGVIAKQRGLRGKPAPDRFLAVAAALNVTAGHVVKDLAALLDSGGQSDGGAR